MSAKNLKESALIINIILIIGFLGLVWLLIYGNIFEVNFFDKATASYTNETITLQGLGDTPAGVLTLYNGLITPSSVFVANATDGATVPSTNYSLTGNVFINTSDEWEDQEVNVSYSATYDDSNQEGIDQVILNNTAGTTQFFGYAPLWFTIFAIIVLVAILLGLLLLVMKVLKLTQGKKNGFSE